MTQVHPTAAPGTEPGRDSARHHVVVVGGGMAAHRVVESLLERDNAAQWTVTVFADEPRAPYDRVALTSYFSGRDPDSLTLGDPAMWTAPEVTLHRSERVESIDRAAQQITTDRGRVVGYDELVLATGSYPSVPPVAGSDEPGCFVYRTLDDVAALRSYVEGEATPSPRRVGAVIGGGLLGLEAAGALRALGLETHVVEFAPRLMPIQVDAGGGEALRRLVEELGVITHLGTATEKIERRRNRSRMTFAGGERLDVDVVVFATGVRPRDELARNSGLVVGERGGIVIDDTCRTSDPHIWAVGECACLGGRVYGLVSPAYAMAEVVVDRLDGGASTVPTPDLSTKLKLLGVDVASFGDAHAAGAGSLEVVYADPVAGKYSKLVLSDDAQTLLGGVFVGDASAYATLRPILGRALTGDPASMLLGDVPAGAAPELPDDAAVCSCHNVTGSTVREAVRDHECSTVDAIKTCTKAGTGCGSCVPLVKKLLNAELEKKGSTVDRSLCEHFSYTRAELFDIIRVKAIGTFSELVGQYGNGRGCDICKPVVASILASLGNGHILDGEQAALQDTNDHFLANMQKDGTYSVVPRVPGGEITPDKLIVIGEVAKDFDLYVKITGGQRIDLLGARVEQLPAIWRRLVDAGMESGHAYGKALRTVKSCVGNSWCRFGVQDSVGLAIALELRYRGLRAPHKIKLGVSGCARECAEARSKDVGIIATENGWNLYLGGNGGFTPRHAELFAKDLSTDDLIRTIDRFLTYYVRTADRLQRTAAWLADLDGGLEQLRRVIVDDALGIADELDNAMDQHAGNYADEWQQTLEDPQRLQRFVSFVNAPDTPDPDLRKIVERGQSRPAGPVSIAGAELAVVSR